jgi:hypothetical protein
VFQNPPGPVPGTPEETTMNTYRRVAAITAATACAAFTAVASPASGAAASTDRERPCFIVQAHWNTAFDGPAPTCPVPD